MNKLALRQAWERFHRAQAAHKKLLVVRTPDEIDHYWSEFLTAAATVYSKLEKGAKGDQRSEPWFGRIKNERRNDPLLSYVHHARNSDEHGIQRLTEKRPHSIRFSGNSGPVTIKGFEIDEDGVFHHDPENEGIENMKVEMRFVIRLASVKDDRFGDTFDPPKTHLGKPLPNEFPETLSGLTLEYLERVLKDAAQFTA